VGDYLPPYGSAAPRESRTAVGAITGGLLVTTGDVVAGADSVTWVGVASHDAAIGESYGIYKDGIQNLVASAAIAIGARVKCAAAGKIVTFVDGTDVHTRLVGVAKEAAAADGDVIKVEMAR
jgi:hypothetical protein